MSETALKVGELARRTGVTVRTLHHYDHTGLLSPSHRTPSGHRLYGRADVARLQQIRSLRQLGLSLDEVRSALESPGFSPLGVVEAHLARLREQIGAQQRLCARLETVAAGLRAAEEVSADTLIQTIEEMTMFEKYYTPEQMEQLRQRREAVGEERIREVEAEWPRLIAAVRAEMERGTDPASDPVQELVRRWRGLVAEFTGGDPGIERSLGNLHREQGPELSQRFGEGVPDAAVFEYVSRAMAAGKE